MSQAKTDPTTAKPAPRPKLRWDLDLQPGKTDCIYFDDELTGFGLRVRQGAGGKLIRNWIAQYRVGSQARRMIIAKAEVIKSAAQAREAARKVLAKVVLGGDPQGDKQQKREADAVTLKAVAVAYVEHKKPGLKPNSHAMLHHYLVGQLPGPHKNWRSKKNVDSWLKPCHGKPAHAVSKGDISSVLKRCEENSGKPSAVALRSAVSSMYAWAIREGTFNVDKNPVIHARKIETDDGDDEDDATGRVLSEGELVKLWQGVDPESDFGKITRLLVLTCCRRGEIGGMKWSELDDPENPTKLTIPESRLKNGKKRRKKKLGPFVVPLSPLAAEIIKSVQPRDGVDHLFGGWAGNGFTSFSKGKRDVDKKIRIAPWKIHHLRRITTILADMGVPPHIAEEILGHTSGGSRDSTARRYNRSNYPVEVRNALAMWSDHVAEITQRDPVLFNEKAGAWLVDA